MEEQKSISLEPEVIGVKEQIHFLDHPLKGLKKGENLN